ncbi:MAG: hypothetical protein JJU29_20010 [Verrucomicrobia bacterium]|nr:hypothetical protein [Verrucomicrobiota bacterium]MCH8514253.1 hypothetical protein [Kiritimatiellia bacterium]
MADPFGSLDNIQFNAADLWREEVYTDRTVGSIRVMIPVTVDGEPDLNRKTEYFAQTQVMTGSGPLPVEGPIEADSLKEAIAGFGKATKAAVEDMIERAREMQREAANQIVTPGQAMGGGMPRPGGGQGGGQGGNPFTLR